MTPYLLATTLTIEAGGPDTTPRSTGFKVGIPYVYALKVRFITTRGERPREEPADVFDGDGSATAYSRIPSSADLHARVPLRASA